MPRERTQHAKFGGTIKSADYSSPQSPSKGLNGASGRRTELSACNAAEGTRWPDKDAPAHHVNPKR